ncbi:MAG TPA: hypothetical protein VGP13_01885 [Candidatus Paceibacterota bacterium]|jgi:hypothetical protein|nr:hypothetical protein [Candidatus Paceibacterota bacterium]
MRHTHTALHWIVGILNELKAPYEIDGGMAAEAYGVNRELADIDINVSEEDFYKIVPKVHEYIHFGPAWYRDEHWELLMMTIKYAGQNIDISPVEQMRYFDHEAGQWVQFPTDLSEVRVMEWDGMQLPFINEVKLMIYKKQINRGVDKKDVTGMLERLTNTSKKSP